MTGEASAADDSSFEPNSSSSSSATSSSLLSHLAQSLANSSAAKGLGAARGTVKLHVLFSVPRQARELYPFAHVDADDAYATSKSTPVKALVEHIFVTASFTSPQGGKEDEGQGDKRPEGEDTKLIYALECFLYTLPAHDAALLYVSKIDSSGWGPTPVPSHLRSLIKEEGGRETTVTGRAGETNGGNNRARDFNHSTSITKVLTQAFLSYFASLTHWNASKSLPSIRHISLHILARAQRAYLFPSSEENKNKRVLSDGQLIKWWRAIVSEVSCHVRRRCEDLGKTLDVRNYYIIPGYTDLESHPLVPLPPRTSARRSTSERLTSEQALAEAHWIYGHPYSRKGAGLKSTEPLPPLPLSGPSFDMRSAPLINEDHIATLLPHFPDDPKSRFIAEISRDSHEHAKGSSQSQQSSIEREGSTDNTTSNTNGATGSGSSQNRTTSKRRSATPSTPTKRLKAENGRASSSSRRNTPVHSSSASASPSPSPIKLTSTQRIHMRERGGLNKVSPDEFWERMGFRQECCSGNAVGVFVALFTLMSKDEQKHGSETASAEAISNGEDRTLTGDGRRLAASMECQPFALPHPTIKDIVYKHLLIDACEWNDAAKAVELTRTWNRIVERNLKRKAAGAAAEEARNALSQATTVPSTSSQSAQQDESQEGSTEGVVTRAEEEIEIGRDHVWMEVELQGPTLEQIKTAEEKWKELSLAGKVPKDGESTATAKQQAPAVNTLSVKRKRKD